jgi:hypothetical protein
VAAGEDIAKKYKVKITASRSTALISYTGRVFPVDVKGEDVVEREDILSFGEPFFKKLSFDDGTRNGRAIKIMYAILKV